LSAGPACRLPDTTADAIAYSPDGALLIAATNTTAKVFTTS
jgi:hypothetical protein